VPFSCGQTALRPENISHKEAMHRMKDLLSLLNGAICLRALFSYDEKGFMRPETRVVLFGQWPLTHP
jgi:hypothetical protein